MPSTIQQRVIKILKGMDSRREMERKLSKAVINGNVVALKDLLNQDPILLDRVLISSFSETPLHVASMLGHLDLVNELLSLNPELASEFNSSGSFPLHLASTKGHLDIVKKLLLVDSKVSMVRNQDGFTPLHMAALKGRVQVLAELVRVKPESIWTLTDRRETVLHLCVVRNRFEGLKVLIETIGKDHELVNWKDTSGNTVLHIAVAKKQIEVVKYLLAHSRVDVNALNISGSTALDILMTSPRDLRDIDIQDSLLSVGALSSKDLPSIVQEWTSTNENRLLRPLSLSLDTLPTKMNSFKKPVLKHKHTDWLGRKRSALMVVASLIATVAFQASISPPGGVWQDDLKVDSNSTSGEKSHTVGTSVMAYNEPIEYGQFMIFNTIAFLASLSIILLLVSGLPIKRRRWMWIQMVIMWIAITAQVITYFISLRHMSPKDNDVQSMLREVTEISVLTWLCLMGVVFIGNIVRMNLWILRKYGYLKPKEVHSNTINDEREEV